jgi:aminopeptidase N
MGRMLPRAALLVSLALAASPSEPDPRAAYDVQAYRLDLSVDPRTRMLSGTVAVDAVVTETGLARLVLDLQPPLEVQSVVEIDHAVEAKGPLGGTALVFERKGSSLSILLPKGRQKGDPVRVAVAYSGKPKEQDSFEGFHWKKTPEGKPWVCTSCQGSGSSSWWPCKDSFWHPEDKPERTFVNLTVPDGLIGVSNGRLESREKVAAGTETFHWVHEYPCETYSIAIDVAPYVVVEQELEVPGLEGEPATKVPFATYAIPEDAEKAKVQFAEVPEMLGIYSKAFGPFPFPNSKFALVEANFWGMEHSTCVAYGSTFPAWCREHGEPDAHAAENARFDYILVHESAHEWWGNGVSAKSWGHFWIHEGFATYAEAVYLEEKEDAETAQAHLDGMKSSIGPTSRLFRGENVDSGAAYGHEIYVKGAWVLHTLRTFVDDDDLWWKALRDFNLAFRYKNADSDDFRAVLEKDTGKNWKQFFDEFVYGEGYPILDGVVTAKPRNLLVQIQVKGSGKTEFHVPIEVTWREGSAEKKKRIQLQPGANQVEIPIQARARDIAVTGLDRVLCEHSIRLQ